MIRPLSKSILLFKTIWSPFKLLFSFSNQQQENSEIGEIKQLNRAENFYRNSIRKININDKGRGIFTEHHLIRLTKLTQKPEQLPLLFEGYYNYLGHHTVISSKTVDRMLDKALTFQEEPLDPILEVFTNHNYLSYFPSYNITLKTINAAEKDPDIIHKFLLVLTSSPLIKFNKQIVDKLLGMLKDESLNREIYSRVVKLLVQRSALKIIDQHISSAQLLNAISDSLEKRLAQSTSSDVKANSIIHEFLNQLSAKEEKTEEQAATLSILGIFFRKSSMFYNNLLLIKDLQRVDTILSYLISSSNSNFSSIVRYIELQSPSEAIRNGIQKARENRGVTDSQENEGEKEEQGQKEE